MPVWIQLCISGFTGWGKVLNFVDFLVYGFVLVDLVLVESNSQRSERVTMLYAIFGSRKSKYKFSNGSGPLFCCCLLHDFINISLLFSLYAQAKDLCSNSSACLGSSCASQLDK